MPKNYTVMVKATNSDGEELDWSALSHFSYGDSPNGLEWASARPGQEMSLLYHQAQIVKKFLETMSYGVDENGRDIFFAIFECVPAKDAEFKIVKRGPKKGGNKK